MELEVNVIKLENGLDYIIIDAIQNENNKYLFLVNKNNEDDLCIRKIYIKDNEEFLVKLDNDEEFEEALELYNLKNNKDEGLNEE